MAEFPFSIEAVSRFRPKSEVRDVLKRTAALTKWKLQQDKYPGFVRRVALETPEERDRHEHADEEL